MRLTVLPAGGHDPGNIVVAIRGGRTRAGFATLYQDRQFALKSRYRGVEDEDAMADMYGLSTFNANHRAASWCLDSCA